jgi:hypothetical protein
VPTTWDPVSAGELPRRPSGWSSRRCRPGRATRRAGRPPTTSCRTWASCARRPDGDGQPYLDAVDEAGETALLHFGGVCSHAVRKGPLLLGARAWCRTGWAGRSCRRSRPGPTSSRSPRRRWRRSRPSLGPDVPVLYARVDLVDGPDGTPLVLELELVEPSLFLPHGDGARAVRARRPGRRCTDLTRTSGRLRPGHVRRRAVRRPGRPGRSRCSSRRS